MSAGGEGRGLRGSDRGTGRSPKGGWSTLPELQVEDTGRGDAEGGKKEEGGAARGEAPAPQEARAGGPRAVSTSQGGKVPWQEPRVKVQGSDKLN